MSVIARWRTFGAIALAIATCAFASTPPNIVFILADDLGWRDLGCYGSTYYETPRLDRLAGDGIRFTQAYAACNVCSPTRASILTGKYPARLHLTDWLPGRRDSNDQKLKRPNIATNLPLAEVTFAELLKQSGYATAFIGKWHLGEKGHWPEQQGFDLNIGGCDKGHPPSYFSPYKIPTLKDGPAGEYLTDRLTDEALQFIRANTNTPFLLYLSHYAVHNPQQAKTNFVEKYRRKLGALDMQGPEFVRDHGRQVRQLQNKPVYAAMVESLDESVGRILDVLAELKLETNTLVVFTSDNGGLSTAEGTPTSNYPLRMGKGWNYEGGIREPLIIRWAGVTKPHSTCDAPVISMDLFSTFVEAAGQAAPPKVDGVSLIPLIKGGALAERPLFWHYPHYSNQGGTPSGAVRLGNRKLIELFEDDTAELYDLSRDVGERRDIARENTAEATKLRELLRTWRADVGAQMPSPNPDYRR